MDCVDGDPYVIELQNSHNGYHQEIRDYITTGVTRVNLQSLSSKRVVDSFSGNMTLLRPGCNTWAVTDDCCPYFSHDIDLELHRYDGCKVTLASLCMEMLKKWVECFQAAMEESCVLKIYMWLGEATEVCDKDLPESLRFDFIDTSNVADKIGLVSVLSCSRDRLKQPNGVLRTESFDYTRLEGVVSVERYLSGCIDVPVLMYPTVFGLHLAEELSLGHESVPPTQFPLRTKLTLKWKTAREQKNLTAITLDEKASDAVSAALEKVKTCPGLDGQGPLGHVIKACVKGATENILQRVQNFAKAPTKSNTLIEYTDHYLVIIQTDPECLKKGIFSMDCVDGDPYVIELQNSHNGYHQEIRDYITTGVTRVNLQSLSSKRVVDSFSGNMTMLKPGWNIWVVPDDCCPYLSHDIDLELHRYDGCKVTLASLCMEMLKKWVECFQAAMEDSCILKIYMWLGEATEVCEKDLPESLRFDFIDTSNLADKIGLVSVLSCSRDRLKQPNGVLRTESFDYTRLKGVVSVERYLSGCIDVPVLMYPTVFGLHLAEELSLGHESLPPTQFPLRTKLTLKWKTAREQKNLTAITLDEKASDAVSAALEKVKTCPGLDGQGHLGHIIKACVKSATENILQRVQNFAKATTKSNTLVEYKDHYLVTIQTDPECLKKGIFSMDCVDGDPYVIVLQNSHNGQSSFRETLSLSCGIALKTSKVKVSRKRGRIEAHLVKDADVTLGERVLPWNKLTTSSVADLRNFPLSESGKETIETYVGSMCLSSPASLSHHMSPKEQLRFLMAFILIKAPFSFGLPTLITIRAQSVTIHDKRANNMLRLEDLKIHENKPTLFLTFFDFDKAASLVSQKKITNEEILPWKQTKKTCVELDPSSSPNLSKGYALLVKLLEVNSIRMIQDQPEDRRWMTRTILRGRYPYKELHALK
ncbi:uncharacterized protein LOC124286778 [Haliotis rubra]|uniref:uncharacterized protein LOC124286778 n=1 Tax=Haliotis rubra TaxID=36100 RepID=UPI001EE50050|nr:uncharacterized protein LOC124286778 [Haliotis rubra]